MEISELQGKTWKQLVSICKNEPVLLALSHDDELVEAAKLGKEQGPEVAACYVSAVLMVQKSALMAIDAAAVNFKIMADKHKMPEEFYENLRIMEEQTCWAGTPYRNPCPTEKWVIRPPDKYLEDHGGLLILLLSEGIKRISQDRSGGLMAYRGAKEFLDWIMSSGGLREIKNGRCLKAV